MVVIFRGVDKESFVYELGVYEYIDMFKVDVGEGLKRFGGVLLVVIISFSVNIMFGLM